MIGKTEEKFGERKDGRSRWEAKMGIDQEEGREESRDTDTDSEVRVGDGQERKVISPPLKPISKIGGRLLDYADRWRETCGGDGLVKEGFVINWESGHGKNLIEYSGVKLRECLQQGPERSDMRESVKEALEAEIIVEMRKEDVRLVSPSYVMPKAKGGYRQVLDLRRLNRYVRDLSFKMEDASVLIQLARKGDYATSLDVKAAFNHVPTNPSALSYLAFCFEGRLYAYKGMPFGAKHSPLVFTKIMRVVLGYVRERWCVRCVGYMDDLLFLDKDPERLERITKEVAEYMSWIGWVLAREKCEMSPKQEICFLGWLWNFEKMEVCMKKERRMSMIKLLKSG
jgi:hypothetical protein